MGWKIRFLNFIIILCMHGKKASFDRGLPLRCAQKRPKAQKVDECVIKSNRFRAQKFAHHSITRELKKSIKMAGFLSCLCVQNRLALGVMGDFFDSCIDMTAW